MSLRFYFGPSDAENSRKVYEHIIEQSIAGPEQNFLILVPDQFTMQTQKDLVTLHPRGGIMNIDVLSFGRLGHRVFEEVGRKETLVLDDTGKSLVIQKVASGLKEQLPALGSSLQKQGYIHEVKSAISEFMQYGISVNDVTELIDYAEKRGALSQKLKDLQTVYGGFLEYIREKYITTEETMDLLRETLHRSKLVKNSVVVLDGFTGFTPIQNRLIQELMVQSKEVIVVLHMGRGENPYERRGEQELFALPKKTLADLEKLAAEAGVSRDRKQDIFLREEKEEENALTFLKNHLFRYGEKQFTDKQEEIVLLEATNPKEEVQQMALCLERLIREQGYAYRDIAIVVGDLEGYAPYVEGAFTRLKIPYYMDRTSKIVLNPMIEAMKSALEMQIRDFSYDTVFHYLRSGISDLTADETDRLENYVLETGIRGMRAYSRIFTHHTREMGESQEPLEKLNHVREELLRQVAPLCMEKQDTAAHYVEHLYEFLTLNRVQEKLAAYEAKFTEQGNLTKAREYAQIYRLVMDLLDQIYSLLGEEEISMQEFYEILEAGFGEIEVGTIPQNVDRVLVGDMERTRIKSVKVLFFLGVNDGNIPRSASKGGIISDMDREFLKDSGLELAPTPRQQMFIQRFYLYLCMSRPKEKLYLSYARMNSQGKSIRPAYLIDMLRKVFPCLVVNCPQKDSLLEQVLQEREGLDFLAEQLNRYAAGSMSGEQETDFYTLYKAYEENGYRRNRDVYRDAAFIRYKNSPLSTAVATALYGKILENSVSRLETFAACSYRHFLQYGLSLKEREEMAFEAVDMGNTYHGVLQQFAEGLTGDGHTWFDFEPEYAAESVSRAMDDFAAVYGAGVLYRNARNEYAITRMKRVLTRTVLTLQEQLKKGFFAPVAYEVSFRNAEKLQDISLGLSGEERMRLIGRIDRVDEAIVEDRVYVKVVDYKSGDKQFDLAALYHGLQLQLVVYMDAALAMEAKKHPEKSVLPAAMLYYHVDDPTVESATELTEEEINEAIRNQLRTRGVVQKSTEIVKLLDSDLEGRSQVIPVELKQNGDFSARSSVLTSEDMELLSEFVNKKIRGIGREILDGKIAVNPYEKKKESACTYCSFQKVCGFDETIPGYRKRKLEEPEDAVILERMREEL